MHVSSDERCQPKTSLATSRRGIGPRLARGERGDDKPWIGVAAGDLRLADDAAAPAPTIQRRLGEVLEAPRRLAGPVLSAAAVTSSSLILLPGARCAPGRTGSRHGSSRTTPSASRGQSRNRRAAGCAPVASTGGSARRCVQPPRPHRQRRRCSTAAASPPAGAGRRRCRAAGNSSSHNSRGRTGLPGARAAGRRWHPDRE